MRKSDAAKLLAWYEDHARDLPWRRDREPYHVWLSEVMLQQTRVEAVKEYYLRFLRELPEIKDLANVPDETLMKLWEGLGYYRRAVNLKRAAEVVCDRFGGVFPRTYGEIRELPGIGDYTAGAIGSICFDLPEPAVDGNVLRVWSRLGEEDAVTDLDATKKAVREELREIYEALPRSQRGKFTQSLMELGATVCIPNGTSRCESCPLAKSCMAKAHGTFSEYPVRAEKKARRVEDRTVFVWKCDDRIAIRKREDTGLLAGLWEFPSVEGVLDERAAMEASKTFDTNPIDLEMMIKSKHIFTHVEWRMTAYIIRVEAKAPAFTWVTKEELIRNRAIPSAFRFIMETITDNHKEVRDAQTDR